MTNTTPTPDAKIETMPLADLILSDLNPRQDVDEDEITALANSIRVIGLMQNLSGLIGPRGKVEIVAGGRRLRALQRIADEDGTAYGDVAVPVSVTDNLDEAQAWAAAENIVRVPLHPADEIRAFEKMARTGMDDAEIAKAFGVTMRHVAGRMKLAGLPEIILDALRSGEITLDVASAYTVANDAAHAVEVFEAMRQDWRADRPGEIKRMLTGDDHATRRLVKFVGRARYEAEGGAVTEDLFGDDVFFADHALLAKLATEKLEGERAIHMAAGWKWVEISFDRPDWQTTEKMGRTYPTPHDLPEDDAARYDELAERVETGGATEDQEAEFAKLEAILDRQDFTAEQMEHAGAFLWIGQGEFCAEYGMIKPEDIKAAEAAGVCRTSRHAAAKEAKKGPYSGALTEDLARVRTGAVQTALLDNPALALDLLTFALSVPVYSGALPLDIITGDAANMPKDGAGMDLPKALQADEDHQRPKNAEDALKAFTAFQRKKTETKAKLLAEHVARILSIGLSGETANPFAEAIAMKAGLDVRRVWTPTTEFLKRLTKSQLLEVHRHIMGRDAPSTQLAKQAKSSVANWLHLIFNGGTNAPTLTDEQRARADAWVPEGMACPAPKKTVKAKEAAKAA